MSACFSYEISMHFLYWDLDPRCGLVTAVNPRPQFLFHFDRFLLLRMHNYLYLPVRISMLASDRERCSDTLADQPTRSLRLLLYRLAVSLMGDVRPSVRCFVHLRWKYSSHSRVTEHMRYSFPAFPLQSPGSSSMRFSKFATSLIHFHSFRNH